MKHLLGRPPISQAEISTAIQLIADQGFDAFVDSLVHCEDAVALWTQLVCNGWSVLEPVW